MAGKQYYCEKCNKTLDADQFYTSNNLIKYPNDGKFPQCKKCMTMHVDNWNPDTYLWILQEADVPYIPDEWNKLMASYARDGKKVTGMTILGRYLSKMKLKQFRDYRWKDTEFLQEMANKKIEETMKRQGYGAAEIAQALDKASFEVPEGELTAPEYEEPAAGGFTYNELPVQEEDIGLTEEDQNYLLLKWGKAYKPSEWVRLEQLYNDMMASYDIQGAGHEDTLKLVCKTSLKCNQLIDIGDVEGYQKMSKVYNDLMKSGNFTAAQNKAETGEFVDSVGELVMLCEKEGYIERYYVTDPKDKVDETLLDMKRYTRTLINEETNLSNMIEAAIKQNAKEDEAEKEAEEQEIVTEDDLTIEELEHELHDDDYSDFYDFLEEDAAADHEEEEDGSTRLIESE